MKLVLSAVITLVSVMALADVRPHIEPGPLKDVDAEALNVLVYGASEAKLADLKAGSNAMVVQRQNLSPGVTRFSFTTRHCAYRGVSLLCLENKQMTVTKILSPGTGHGDITYKASAVLKVR